MTTVEYNAIKDLSYRNYCNYLLKKYGVVPYTYGNQKNRRPEEGLFIHHIGENEIASLSNAAVRKASDPKYQKSDMLVYCNYLEHLFLHILIGEETAGSENLGLNGPFVYIIPSLLNYFNFGYKNTAREGKRGGIHEGYYTAIEGQKEVFNLLLDRYNKVVTEADILLDHNQTLYAQVEKTLEEKGKALVVLGTGLGKTTTALHYVKTHNCRALVIGPNKLIKDGWDRHYKWCDTITYQSFAKEYKTINYDMYGVVILDEAHHIGYDESANKGAEVWSTGIRYILKNNIKVMGLTATPKRTDSINVGNAMFGGCVCEGLAIEDAIDQDIIYPFSYITALYDTEGLVKEIKEKYADGDEETKKLIGQLDLAVNNTPTMREIFEKHMPKDTKRKGIIFIQEIEDKAYVVDIFKKIYPEMEFRSIDSKMSADKVAANREWFKNTNEGYLLAVNMISEGAHYKGVNTLIMFRRTSSYLVYAQQLGRIITLTKDEDPHTIVFDLVNNADTVEYNDKKVENKKERRSVSKIIEAIKKQALKSSQIIVSDETRNICEVIRQIKESAHVVFSEYDLIIIQNNYNSIGAAGCARLINFSRRQIHHQASIMGLINPFRAWDEQEIKLINKLYSQGMGLDEIASHLEYRTINSIRNVIRRERISHRFQWTEEKILLLKKLYPTQGSKCYKEVGCSSPQACACAAAKFGVIYENNSLQDKELEIIKKYYPLQNWDMMLKLMPTRSKKYIQEHASKYKIKAIKRGWTDEQTDLIKKFYSQYGGKKLITMFPHVFENKNSGTLNTYAKTLGLKFNFIKIKCIETNQIMSIKDAAKMIQKSQSLICLALKNPDVTAGGYHWKYVDEDK